MGERKYQLRILYFFSLGLWSIFTPVIVSWIAVEDILAGTLWSSTVVLVVFSIPDIITKAFSSYIIKRISFRSAFILLTLFLVGSNVLLVIIDDVRIRMVGVGVLGIAYGFGQLTCVRMLSYYEHADLHANAFQNGSNIAPLAASLAYTGLTTWTCLAPRIAIAACIPFCLLPLVFYFLLDKEPLVDHLKKTTDRQSVKYAAVNDEDSTDDNEAATPSSKQNSKAWFIFKAYPFMGYAFLTNFCAHLIMTAVLTTLTFESSPFQPRDHFQYYRLINNFGISFGGTFSLLFSCLDAKWTDFFRIRKTWALALLNVIHLVFFVFASWYRFLPNVTVVLVMCFTQGIIDSITLVNIAANCANEFSSASDKGTALGLMQLGLSVGQVVAGLKGISTEKLLREHCEDRLMLGRFCLARPASHAEWSTSLSCKSRKNILKYA